MQRIIFFFVIIIMFLTSAPGVTNAQDIPNDIYQWVQGSPRVNYYFNKEQIKYAIGSDGWADTNILEVPILEQFDWIKIQDVIQKKRWNDEDVSNFNNLWGCDAIVHINISAQTVTYVDGQYLNVWWSPIGAFNNGSVESIDKLSSKNLEKIFYDTIITYATTHKQDLMQKQLDQINPADLKAAGITVNNKKASSPKSEKQKIKDIITGYKK